MLLVDHMVLPWLPVMFFVLVMLALFSTGVGLMLSAANVFYHDVNYLWGILVQILFYATPIIYFPAQLQFRPLVLLANYGPTASFITAVHNIMYDLRCPGPGRMLFLTFVAFGTFFLGAWVFGRLSPKFAEEM